MALNSVFFNVLFINVIDTFLLVQMTHCVLDVTVMLHHIFACTCLLLILVPDHFSLFVAFFNLFLMFIRLQVTYKAWLGVWWTMWILWSTTWSWSTWRMISCCQSTLPPQSATLLTIYGRGPSWTSLVSKSCLHSLLVGLKSKSTQTRRYKLQ